MPFPLATVQSALQDQWNVAVIGSGYGGSIMAARLAQAGVPQICVLERGKEWLPGDFPDSLGELADNLRLSNLPANRLGLFDYMLNSEIDVLRGNGLGGTSLINANVAIRPDDEFFEKAHWPTEIRELFSSGELWNYYSRAEVALGVMQHPRGMQLRKVLAMKRRADQLPGSDFRLLNLAVNHDIDGVNDEEIEQKPCIDCGDCFSGCNVGAKNTLNFNYLPMARNAGASIFTRIEVSHIEARADGKYVVHYNANENHGQGPERLLVANHVIVSAGALGSTEILLRSKQNGLEITGQLGAHFSGNADFVAIAYNNNERTDVLGYGNQPGSMRSAVKPGPSIVSGLSYNRSLDFSRRYIVEDFSFPLALVDAARRAFPFIVGRDTDSGIADKFLELQRMGMDLVSWNPLGALNRTMVYLAMGADDSVGKISLDPLGKLRIDWPGVPDQAIFREMNAEIERHAETLGGTFIENFRWTFLGGRNLITVHPLGGCRMARDADQGVVDARGRVYNGEGGVHAGLFVVDGSMVPSAAGVNPFLTISALSERIAEQLAAELTS